MLSRWAPIVTSAALASALLACHNKDSKGPTPLATTVVTASGAPTAVPAPGERVRTNAWRAAVAERQDERAAMVRDDIAARDITDSAVLEALRRVPRHRFVPGTVAARAYDDSPLPIVGGQTISQPYIVALMTDAVDIQPRDRCLEIGTGSGYQAAILAELCAETYSIEYLPEVATFGRQNLEALGYAPHGVALRVGDGYAGWPERAPFDVIVVTAAPEKVPAPLLEQLALHGRLVIPVGGRHEQALELWTRKTPGNDANSFARKVITGVRFVPFLGPQGK